MSLLRVAAVALLLGLVTSLAGAATISVPDWSSMQAAANGASAGDVLQLVAGTYAVSSGVIVNKAITVDGQGSTLTITGGGYNVFKLSGGATLTGFHFEKTDAVNQDLVYVGTPNVTVQNNTFEGVGAGRWEYPAHTETTRAMVVEAGAQNILIDSNTISHLRQPAYLDPGTGTISNNTVTGTKGFVADVTSGGAALYWVNNHFSGNVTNDWGVCTTGPVYGLTDICFIGTNCPYDPIAVSAANNNAVIVDKAHGATSLRVVNTTQNKAYATIQEAVDGAIAGDILVAAATTFNEAVTITKPLTLQGTPVTRDSVNPRLFTSGTVINGGTIDKVVTVAASDVTLKDFGVLGRGDAGSVNNACVSVSGSVSNLTMQNLKLSNSAWDGFEVNEGATLTGCTIDGCDFSYNRTDGFHVRPSGSVTGLMMADCQVDYTGYNWVGGGQAVGLNVEQANANPQTKKFEGTIEDCTFNWSLTKGFYLEKGSNLTIKDVTIDHCGYDTVTTRSIGGLDINLKYGSYSNITLDNVTVTNAATGHNVDSRRVASIIKGRNDGSYAGNPGSLTNLSIIGGTYMAPSAATAAMSIGNKVSGISFSGGTSLSGPGIGLSVWTDAGGTDVNLGNTSLSSGLAAFVTLASSMNVQATSADFGGLRPDWAAIEAKVYHHPDSGFGPGWVIYAPNQVLGSTIGWDVTDGKFYLCSDATNPASGVEIVSGNSYIYAGNTLTCTITGIPGDKTLVVNGAGQSNSLRMVWYLRNGVFYRGVATSTIGGAVTSASYQRGMTYTGGVWQPGLQFLTHALSGGPTWTVTGGNATQAAP